MNIREQLQYMLTLDNWEMVQGYVNAAAHNEDGPDWEITDQMYEDAINEIVSENRAMAKIMREDWQKYCKIEKENAALREDKELLDHLDSALNQLAIFGYFVMGGQKQSSRAAIRAHIERCRSGRPDTIPCQTNPATGQRGAAQGQPEGQG